MGKSAKQTKEEMLGCTMIERFKPHINSNGNFPPIHFLKCTGYTICYLCTDCTSIKESL